MDEPTKPNHRGPDVRGRLLIVGLGLLAFGLIAGLAPLARSGETHCGSGFVARESEVQAEIRSMQIENGIPIAEDDCDGARAPFRVVAFVGLGAGAVVLVGCWVLAGSARRLDA